MRFSEETYGKVFPKVTEVPHVESAVETFKPTEEPVVREESAIEVETVEETYVEEGELNGRNGVIDNEQ